MENSLLMKWGTDVDRVTLFSSRAFARYCAPSAPI